jgi:hypothetical protein
MRQVPTPSPGTRVAHQLALLPDLPAGPVLPSPLISIRPRQVWGSLSPRAQAQMRAAFRRVAQEVLDAADADR